MVNGHNYNCRYVLVDGIYPQWSIFIQIVDEPQGKRLQHFAKAKEVTCKDVEHCFGVLQVQIAIIVNPCHQWDYETIVDILMACVVIILHNTILEDDCDDDVKVIESNVGIQF